jgi:hypothetical protein
MLCEKDSFIISAYPYGIIITDCRTLTKTDLRRHGAATGRTAQYPEPD